LVNLNKSLFKGRQKYIEIVLKTNQKGIERAKVRMMYRQRERAEQK
jgi:hypothetical protein